MATLDFASSNARPTPPKPTSSRPCSRDLPDSLRPSQLRPRAAACSGFSARTDASTAAVTAAASAASAAFFPRRTAMMPAGVSGGSAAPRCRRTLPLLEQVVNSRPRSFFVPDDRVNVGEQLVPEPGQSSSRGRLRLSRSARIGSSPATAKDQKCSDQKGKYVRPRSTPGIRFGCG